MKKFEQSTPPSPLETNTNAVSPQIEYIIQYSKGKEGEERNSAISISQICKTESERLTGKL